MEPCIYSRVIRDARFSPRWSRIPILALTTKRIDHRTIYWVFVAHRLLFFVRFVPLRSTTPLYHTTRSPTTLLIHLQPTPSIHPSPTPFPSSCTLSTFLPPSCPSTLAPFVFVSSSGTGTSSILKTKYTCGSSSFPLLSRLSRKMLTEVTYLMPSSALCWSRRCAIVTPSGEPYCVSSSISKSLLENVGVRSE